MPIEAGMKYDADVIAAKMTQSKDGKPGIWVNFAILGADGKSMGSLPKTIWLTPANREHARKDLQTLGATEEQVSTTPGFRDLIGNLTGYLDADVSVTTEEEEYNGRTSVKVKWINRRVPPASRSAIDQAEALFGGSGGGDLSDDPGPEDAPY